MTTKPRKGSLLGLRDKAPVSAAIPAGSIIASGSENFISDENAGRRWAPVPDGQGRAPTAPSREGRKAMTGYFPPALSQAMRITAVRNNMSLQDAMGEAMNDWLRKMGESPVGM